MPEPDFDQFADALTLSDRIRSAMTRFEVLHGVPCQHVRLNSRDYHTLSTLCELGDVIGLPSRFRGAEVVSDDRVLAPQVDGIVRVQCDA